MFVVLIFNFFYFTSPFIITITISIVRKKKKIGESENMDIMDLLSMNKET